MKSRKILTALFTAA
ncbi:Protein of unknown function [Lactobacillus helveticus CIRM-BIA 951]|nr:Protein of unknown function [Lactobacillus helveticus CIRM-BIA 951]